jgi:hypothetical protein
MAGWITVGSSWVDAYQYDSGTLFVRYKSRDGVPTVTCQYDDISFDLWLEFLAAESKGKFIHKHLIRHPYKIVS